MADVSISVGLIPKVDTTQFETELNNIFSKYEKSGKPLKIDVQVGKDAQSSLSSLEESLKKIQDRAKATAKSLRSVTNAIQSADKKNSNNAKQRDDTAYKKNVKAIERYYKTLKQFRKSDTDIENINGEYVSKSGNWSRLAQELNEAAKAYNNVVAAASKLSQTGDARLSGKISSAKSNYELWEEQQSNKRALNIQRSEAKITELDRKAAALQTKLRGRLADFSAALTSNHTDSRDAYANMSKQIQELDAYRAKLKEAGVDVAEFDSKLRDITTAANEDAAAIRNNGDAHKSFGHQFDNMVKKFGTWLTASQMVMMAVRSVRKMVNEAVAVDAAMNQMQIVTKANSDQMKQFGDTAAAVAKQTSSSMTDIVNSATTFARLGYNMDTSTILAKYTSMLSKVGDIGVSDVQSAVTAIVKAFNIDANDTAKIESVFDKLVLVGNNFPVSVSELAEGLNNASSALAAAGNSYEQSLALLASSNATVQDISKSSTGLRTIVARIRNTKTELDSLGESMSDAEYDKIVGALTKYKVSLTDSSGNLRNTYDIIKDIADVAEELKKTSPNDYAALAETLAGTRMQNIFFSLVENFDEAEKAMQQMGDSAGTLNDAFEVYTESIASHIEVLKTQFQELAVAVVDSDIAKFFVDTGAGLLKFTTSVVKAAGVIPTLVGAFAAFKSIKSIS